APVRVGGYLAKFAQRASVVAALYLGDFELHPWNAASPSGEPPVAAKISSPVSHHSFQHASSFGMHARAARTSRLGACGRPPLFWVLIRVLGASGGFSVASRSLLSVSARVILAAGLNAMMWASRGVAFLCHDPAQRSGWTSEIALGSPPANWQ